MTDPRLPSDEDDALAAEYVIGLLGAAARKDAKKRLRADAGFAARVSIWEVYLEDLNEDYGTQTPPARIKAKIDRQLFGKRNQRWRGWVPIGLATAVFLIAIVLIPTIMPIGVDLQAQLESEDSSYAFSISVDMESKHIDMAVTKGAVLDNATFELWFIPDGGSALSLGTFASGERLNIPPEVGLTANATLAVSIEPSGGSPTGAPTGPVVAIGALKDV